MGMMQEILGQQSKETRCHMMAAVMVFEGFMQVDAMTEIRGEMLLDALGLTKADMESFPMPEYSQIVEHIKPITDSEVRHWVITNTYSPVLKSRRRDALNAFRNFCADLKWDEIKESMELTEELEELKPIDDVGMSMGAGSRMNTTKGSSTSSGCLSVIALIIVSTALFALL